MTEDLSKMTFDERKAFLDGQYQKEEKQAQEKRLEFQETVTRYLTYRASLVGRIRHFLHIDKPEFAKNPQVIERSPEQAEKERIFFQTLSDRRRWEGVYKKFPDGLVYYTNEISIRGKNMDEIEQMQQILQRHDIKTQIDVAGPRQNRNIDSTEVFVNPYNAKLNYQDLDAEIKEGDTVLRIADPASNHRLPNLFEDARMMSEMKHIRDCYIPMTMEEYTAMVKERQPHPQKEDNESLRKMFESALRDSQKREALKRFLEDGTRPQRGQRGAPPVKSRGIPPVKHGRCH